MTPTDHVPNSLGDSISNREDRNCKDNDLELYFKRINQIASDRGLLTEEIGVVANYPILLLKPVKVKVAPTLLVSAGFHGDEPAGCGGILSFLETADEALFSRVNLSFLPLVNPTGYLSGKHTNDWGEDPNRAFCHTDSGVKKPSREGLVLIEHLRMLKSLARDGFVSLHEDIELKQFYLYAFEDSDFPGPFSEMLTKEEQKYFEPCPDGFLEGALVHNGIIFRHCDGSFEDLLFHEGVPNTACTETPGRLDLGMRIKANAGIITALLKFSAGI